MKAMKLFTLTAIAFILGAGLSAGSGFAPSADTEGMTKGTTGLNVQLDQPQEQRYGEDSVMCVRNWSLYAEYYRQRNFNMAWEPWKYMYEECPLATRNIYLHGANMIKYFYQNETDPDKREAWVDTLMMVYDQRMEMFGNEGFVKGRKAADLYQMRPDNIEELNELTERSIELEGVEAGADVLLINFQAAIRLVEAGMMDPGEIIRRYDRGIDIIEYNLEHNPEDARFYNPAKTNIEAMFEPYATCESLVQVFGPRFEDDPHNVELLERITEMLDRSGCTGEELFYMATRNLHEQQPGAESAFLMGRLENNLDNHQVAIDYFEEAVQLYQEDDPIAHSDRIFRSYWLMAEISYRQLNRMSQARNYARQAHEASPTDGRPLILIGEMYAASANLCGDDEFTRKTVYWVAVDKFIEARNVASEPAVAERAMQLISTYRHYFPDRELIFFHGFSEGDPYRVECWINRSTTIRAR